MITLQTIEIISRLTHRKNPKAKEGIEGKAALLTFEHTVLVPLSINNRIFEINLLLPNISVYHE